MSAARIEAAAKLRSLRMHRLIRQLHIWIGAWGALAAVLFGVSGFMQNHRGILKLPQGTSTEVSRAEIPVPEEARISAEALRAWLSNSQHLQLEVQQRGPQGPAGRGDNRGDTRAGRWMLAGGNARTTVQAEYVQGSATVSVRTNVQSPLAVLERLHKGVGGGIAWILLSDSFALGMVALGSSGLVMWSRGRTPRRMLVSVAAVAAVVLILAGASAIL
jgi:hypothetical protein